MLHNIYIENNDEFIDDIFDEVDVQDNIVLEWSRKKRHYLSYVVKLSL